MTVEELQEKQALVKKLKSELKNEEMALVLLKKLKQSQTAAAREVGQVVQGGATLTPATAKTANSKSDPKGQYSSASKHNYDLLAADKLVSIRTCTCPTHVLLSAAKWVESTPGGGESELSKKDANSDRAPLFHFWPVTYLLCLLVKCSIIITKYHIPCEARTQHTRGL